MIPNSIIIHHSASRPNTTINEINSWHKARDFTFSALGYYVGYHYVILSTGEIIQTRKDTEMGCHSIPNDGKIGICLTGNFMVDTPTTAQILYLGKLVDKLKKSYNITNVKGHRDCSKTECPGDSLYVWVLRNKISWLQNLINLLIKAH
jgi:N-acetylmuramoyl-L-alanine amidase